MGELLKQAFEARAAQAEILPQDPRARALTDSVALSDPDLYARLNATPAEVVVHGTGVSPGLRGRTLPAIKSDPATHVNIYEFKDRAPYTDVYNEGMFSSKPEFEKFITRHELGHASHQLFEGGPTTRLIDQLASRDASVQPRELVANIVAYGGVPPNSPPWLTPAIASGVLREIRGRSR